MPNSEQSVRYLYHFEHKRDERIGPTVQCSVRSRRHRERLFLEWSGCPSAPRREAYMISWGNGALGGDDVQADDL